MHQAKNQVCRARPAGAVPTALARAAFALSVAFGLALSGVALSGVAEPEVRHWSADGGGGQSSGGNFELRGVIGQPDADPLQPASGGIFELTGGFLAAQPPSGPLDDPIFADGFETP